VLGNRPVGWVKDAQRPQTHAETTLNPRGSSPAAGSSHPTLLRGIDHAKDQSYVLFGIDRKLLARMLLPVGGFRKPQIRELAAKIGLRVAEKKDSQEICFVTSGQHDEFVRQRRRGIDMSGEIVTTAGRVVGKHPGIEKFTIGQRKKLGVALGEPYFVVRIEPESRRVVIGRHEELARTELTASECNWLVDRSAGEFRCSAKIRYNTPPAAATAKLLPDRRLRVAFDEPRYGIAPGQAVVLYDGEQVLGGGWIEGACESGRKESGEIVSPSLIRSVSPSSSPPQPALIMRSSPLSFRRSLRRSNESTESAP
jgi:tRNA (5-methylaminomethyl-2-thiouridylate)-methyltransferase